MSHSGNRPDLSFSRQYASALRTHLRDLDEGSLRLAYELGRQALSRQLSVLDLSVVHQEALGLALAGVSDVSEAQRAADAAGDFFLESLSSFEMVQRGFKEAREALLLERRQTELSRQLSTFLADASLALDASDSLEEMLRLVAEQARELVSAECCVVTVVADGQPRAAEAASYPEADRHWTALVRWLDLPAIYRFARECGGSVRMAGEQLTTSSLFGSAAADRPLLRMARLIDHHARRGRARGHPAVRETRRGLQRRRRGRPCAPCADGVGGSGASAALPALAPVEP